MDFELPEELRILKATLRRFVDAELIPIERETTDDEQIKPQYLERFERRAKGLGIWQLDVPTEYGGGGMSSCQMPSSLARRSKRSRYCGLICSSSVVSRSIGISSVSTKRRRVALRIRSSSGNSKSIALTFPHRAPPTTPPRRPRPRLDRPRPASVPSTPGRGQDFDCSPAPSAD